MAGGGAQSGHLAFEVYNSRCGNSCNYSVLKRTKNGNSNGEGDVLWRLCRWLLEGTGGRTTNNSGLGISTPDFFSRIGRY